MAGALPRMSFECSRTINWFPGHMAKGLRQVSEKMRKVDLVVEARDSRVPLSGINREFERAIGSKPRLIVYNKTDMIPQSIVKPITTMFKENFNQDAIFSSAKDIKSMNYLLDMIKKKLIKERGRYPSFNIMMVGMPNVGKSSLTNALRWQGMRRGKAVRTGAQPGVTRNMETMVKISEKPTIYIVDTPGVMIPHIPDPIDAIKVALTGGIRDDIADEEIMADYLLYFLNKQRDIEQFKKLKISHATDNLSEFLGLLGTRIGALRPGGQVDTTSAANYFIRRYRDGLFGKMCLDDTSPEGIDEFVSSQSVPLQLSKRQANIELKKEKRRAKSKKDPID